MQPSSARRKNPIPLYALFAANAVSLVGNVFTLIAIPWFVLQTSGSATQTGITGFFAIAPAVLAGGATSARRTGQVFNDNDSPTEAIEKVIGSFGR